MSNCRRGEVVHDTILPARGFVVNSAGGWAICSSGRLLMKLLIFKTLTA